MIRPLHWDDRGSDGFNDLYIAMHDVEYPIRQAGYSLKVQRVCRHSGALFPMALHDHAIARGDRVGNGPVRYHGREIERNDGGHHALAEHARSGVRRLRSLRENFSGHQLKGSCELCKLNTLFFLFQQPTLHRFSHFFTAEFGQFFSGVFERFIAKEYPVPAL